MLKQEYIQLVRALNCDEIRNFAKVFFLCKYKGDGITIENSIWQNTYILTIIKKGIEFKRFIHISDISSNLNEFINANIANIEKYSSNKVYRKLECISLTQINNKEDLITRIDLEYGITLEITDIDALGDAIEDNQDLKNILVHNSSKPISESLKLEQKDKILYDLFTTGNKIANLKNSFISSYIQYYLLELGPQSVGDLKDNLKNPLPNLSSRAFTDAISRSIKNGLVEYKDGKYALTIDAIAQLDEMKAVTAATEERLLKQFEECLDEYGIKDLSHNILETIIELYKAQNVCELATLNHQDNSDITERKLVSELFNSLIRKGIEIKLVDTIIQRILAIVSDSEYLSKVSATTLFTNLFNSDSLDDYLGKQKRVVFIDTQVLLQLLCVDYQDVEYGDSLYEAGRILYKQLQDSKDYISLFTTSDYVREVSNHLYEAYNLKRFVNLPYIRDFGPSKNIFYNFYLYLDESEDMGYSCFDDYIEELLNTDEQLPSGYSHFVSTSDSLVIDILNNIGITIKSIDHPANLSVLRRDYDNILGNHPKSNHARENDVLCMYYLSDQTNFINNETGLIEEPYLLTWDTTIMPMRKRLAENYQRTYWYIYPPLKFANRLSIMNLKLNSCNINYDIICMTETNFKASHETISMLDIISKFFKKDEIGTRKLPRMLAQLKNEEKKDDYLREYSDKNYNNLPIDVVLNDIHRYYRKLGIQYIDNISRLFEKDELSDTIVKLLREGCNMVKRSNHVEDNLYKMFDRLIEEEKEKELAEN